MGIGPARSARCRPTCRCSAASRSRLPIDAGGGDPQDNYQWVIRVDFSLSNNTQMYVRYALQNQRGGAGHERRPARMTASTPGYLNKNHNILGSLTHVSRPDVHEPDEGRVEPPARTISRSTATRQPTLYMNPTGVGARCRATASRSRGICPFSPGSAIPFGGPQKLLQFYQDQTWIKGKHDFRFGGSYVHIADDRTFGAYTNAVEALNTTVGGAAVARQLRARSARAGSRPRSIRKASRAAHT